MRELLIVCPLAFLGGLADSIAGGGGLITLPGYYLAGLPPHVAMGTNKFSSVMGTTVSAARFLRKGSIHLPTMSVATALAIVGSALGARLALILSEHALQVILMILLPVIAVFILTRKTLDDGAGRPLPPLKRALPVSAAVGLIVGAYDGFFGPGTGTFLILSFFFLVKLDLITSMSNTKMVNFASNIAALLTMSSHGKLLLSIGIPAAVCGIAGNYIGSGLAIKNGAKVFRPVLAVMLALLLARVAYDFFGF